MRVIGLMSGTSVDGVDAALIDVSGTTTDLAVDLLASQTIPYPEELRQQILAVCGGASLSMAELAQLDDAIALTFAYAAQVIQTDQPTAHLIGSHGQTIYHNPPSIATVSAQSSDEKPTSEFVSLIQSTNGAFSTSSLQSPISNISLGYSLQIGRGALIAAQTGLPTISNFRAADIAMGGHGAPLVPPVDRYLLGHSTFNRCVQNIGGIGNVAYLPAFQSSSSSSSLSLSFQESELSSITPLNQVCGWDTGPGNTLLDLAVQILSQGNITYDHDGQWASKGDICYSLVERWMRHSYFHQAPPKSTGRELFGEAYVRQCLDDADAYQLSDADTLATITELTAASIDHSYRTFLPNLPEQVLICGGGSRNRYLLERLRSRLSPMSVLTTDDVGVNADFKEAIAFGVLAYWRWHDIPGNLPTVTGAVRKVPLGELHFPPTVARI